MGWSSTARGRRELAFILAFVAVNLAVPLCTEELFPFSRVALLSARGDRYCDYTVVAPDGRHLRPAQLGLGRQYVGLRDYATPASIDRFGVMAGEQLVASTVREHLAELPFVDVTQRVIGAIDANRVGVVETHSFRVER